MSEDYRVLTDFLSDSGIKFLTFMFKDERSLKCTIRGLPSNMDVDQIKTIIDEENFIFQRSLNSQNVKSKVPSIILSASAELGYG
ncbi:hypothetical protein NPIL_351361 [Nephila pilipes]|uniref:Uncharacterized protein n=1 Tax=Nephila pilipes TaxID=299642 RepID=A0A8X6THJ3_NEPPI|nr:hypothetical protein NPIL_351361 [Nephila pilipes]